MALSVQEVRMDAIGQDGKQTKYKTARWVQVWFLGRSRDNWKRKYKELKTQAKRLKNQVNDVTRSRQRWRRRAEDLEKENAALREAALKKDGVGGVAWGIPGVGGR
jgi:uncharacterized protein YlxW (UPF0749 family)